VGATLVVVLRLPAVWALVAGGLVAGYAGASPRAYGLGQRLLKVGVVCLGAGLDLGVVLRVGLEGLGSTALGIGATLAAGLWLTRRLGVAADVGALITVGTAICGGSAIAAAAPTLRARGEDVGLALGVVYALNGAALVVFPAVGGALGLEPELFARWCALAIHDTSSVMGAAATAGPEALALATVTKLARALWIMPVVFLIGVLRTRRGDGTARPAIPWFIVAFLVAAALRSLDPGLVELGDLVATGARHALVLALFALGLGTDIRVLRAMGPRPLVFGLVLWTLTSAGALAGLLLVRG